MGPNRNVGPQLGPGQNVRGRTFHVRVCHNANGGHAEDGLKIEGFPMLGTGILVATVHVGGNPCMGESGRVPECVPRAREESDAALHIPVGAVGQVPPRPVADTEVRTVGLLAALPQISMAMRFTAWISENR
jgi:hypothetical protein